MIFRIVFFLLFSSSLFSLGRENIPLHSHAPHVISYSLNKDFPSGALKPSLLKTLRDFFGIEIFIETGTNLGNTAAIAADIFQEVHSVEVFPEFYTKALQRFQNVSHVFLHFGDSAKALKEIIPFSTQKILFYLDGHFDGGASGKGTTNTPILEEIRAISSSGRKDALLLIDDICDFQASFYPDRIKNTCFENYPDLSSLIEEILQINPRYQICFLGNSLLAFPPSPDIAVSPLLSSCAIDLLSTVADFFSEEELLHAERIIGQAKGSEKEALTLYYQAYGEFEQNHGWKSFSSFWYGLILQEERRIFEAKKIFRKASLHSLRGWRGNPS